MSAGELQSSGRLRQRIDFASFEEARCHVHSNMVRRNIESEVLVGHSTTTGTEAGMQRKRAVSQRHHSRNATGIAQKQTGTQNECKDVTTGALQEEGKRNSIRNAKGRNSTVMQGHQSRNEGGHNRSAAGIQQGCSRNAAKTIGATADTYGERSRNLAGLQQEASSNDRGRSRNPAGNHQEFGWAVAGMQRRPQGVTAGTQQEISRVAAGTQRKRLGPYIGGVQQLEVGRVVTGMQRKRQEPQQELSRKSAGL